MPLSQERSRLLVRLQSRKMRAREGLVLVEGIRAVREALGAGAKVRFAVTSPRLESLAGGPDLRVVIEAGAGDIVDVSDAELDAVSATEHHQGVLLVVEQPQGSLAEVASSARCLLLDAIQDPGNLGTLVRAAAAFAVDGVIALDGSADVWGAKAVRASAGAVFSVPVFQAKWAEAGPALQSPLLVAAGDGDNVRECRERSRFALVVGNEGVGVRPEIREAASGVVSVPMPGATESLNVGMAGSILLFELTQEQQA